MKSPFMEAYDVAEVVASPDVSLPVDKRVPHSWEAFPIAPREAGQPTLLRWNTTRVEREARFRIAVAVDVREEKFVEVYLPSTQRVLGTLDIRYPSVYIPYELPLTPADAGASLREGVGLRMVKGELPLWVLNRPKGHEGTAVPLLPHLYWPSRPGADRLVRLVDRMASEASLQQFGWMEGCVLEGLWELERAFGADRIRPVIERHLNSFLDPQGRLRYEDPRSVPADGRIYSAEMATLPFATLARVWPDHPAINVAIDWWLETVDGERGIIGHSNLTAEGSYVTAYPLAVVARIHGRTDLARLAVQHLLARKERLFDGQALYQQRRIDGRFMFRNWARGCAWYILGLARTLAELGDFSERPLLEEELRLVAAWLMRFQRDDGLWSCYIDEPATGVETSGSSGIAAALALGFTNGWLPVEAFASARRTLIALEEFLTPDGFLMGVCQMNKGGEPLQRGGYRVISQMGMGLMSQLLVAIQSATTVV